MLVTLSGIALSILAKQDGTGRIGLKLPLKGVLFGIGAGIGQGVGLVLIILPYSIINRQRVSLKEIIGTVITVAGVALFFLL